MEFVDLKGLHDSIADELHHAIDSVISESSFIRGPHVDKFEEHFADLVDTSHCVSCANGTDAIYIALRALGVGAGDEVITTSHSWISTSETITQTGAQVVFADTEDDFYTIDPAIIESLITKDTKGIIPVHLYGQPAAMDEIMAIARKHGLWVIEDCAQAHLSEYKGKKVGTLGDIATYSFYPGKNLGAMGDAGAIVTNRADLATYCEMFARHGGKNEHAIEGINSRMDGMQAAVLNVKMKYLDQWTSRREAVAALYSRQLPPNVLTPTIRDDCRHVFHLYVIRSGRRDALKSHLDREGIPTAINYPRALPFYPAYKHLNVTPEQFSVSYRHAEEILSLPIHPLLVSDDVMRVCQAIQDFES
ncbi:MAG: DegT/DnrJ/EryC1/StrS family aminotransferase [Paracoccaceae bacterium]|nr:DegT/DnrJ/EryC1/StrS family aminotransferase [Paracoccaceae bacterium]